MCGRHLLTPPVNSSRNLPRALLWHHTHHMSIRQLNWQQVGRKIRRPISAVTKVGWLGQMAGGRKPNQKNQLGPISAVIPAGRLHEGVVLQIARQITESSLEPGTVLPAEPELARRFGVSRTVVREAVRTLSSQGLIAVRHGSGMRVQPPDRWRYLDPLVLF